MECIQDDRGYNQIWLESKATEVRAERRCDYMISRLSPKAGDKILEIGCGLGVTAHQIARKTGADVLGTDLCAPFIEQARAKFQAPNLSYDVLNFNNVSSWEGRSFDGAVGNGILHHLYYHLDEALLNIKSLLNPGGRIVFLEPNLYNPYVYLIFSYPDWRRRTHLEPDEMAFSKPFIIEKLKKAGYRNIVVEFKDFLLPGIPSFLIPPSILAGAVLEKIPVIRRLSQSLFISAEK